MTSVRIVLLLLVSVLVASSVTFSQSTSTTWEPISEDRLRHPKAGDWLSYRRTDDVDDEY